MKLRFAIAVAIALTTVVMGATNYNCRITGNVPAVPDGASVDLVQMYGNGGSVIATDTVRDGLFTITTEIDSGLNFCIMPIKAAGIAGNRVLYLTPGAEVVISGNDPFVETYPVISNVAEQAQFDTFIITSKELIDSLQKDVIRYNLARANAPDDNAKEAIKIAYRNNRTWRDSLHSAIWLRDIALLRDMPVSTVWLNKAAEIAKSYSYNTFTP